MADRSFIRVVEAKNSITGMSDLTVSTPSINPHSYQTALQRVHNSAFPRIDRVPSWQLSASRCRAVEPRSRRNIGSRDFVLVGRVLGECGEYDIGCASVGGGDRNGHGIRRRFGDEGKGSIG
ncbi:hypothetical protein M407DRAFT_174411 [Tulasnella calospora MUT 4182]|uniref:Uncharacterized protein n=1 Tax=Tulasnella calospora MUT 4182 TaxID=1051891 RepID=A0A0C3QMB4_9AGAM|nr:hypothetical protein M407DRAFT_174411 [Tulasnella calospora MUT 4182]